MATMKEANILLSEAPDYKIRRLARLTRLPLDSDLTMEDCFIYVLWGLFPFYVVQTGCISHLRTPLERYREHVRKAKALRNHFCGQQFWRVRGLLGFGKLPSLSRLLAREGPQAVSILPVEKVPEDIHGGVQE